MSSFDPPELQEVDRLLDVLGIDQTIGSVGAELKSAILDLMDACGRRGQRNAGTAIAQILSGEILVTDDEADRRSVIANEYLSVAS